MRNQPVSIEARRNSDSDKLSKLRNAQSFEAKEDSPRSYIYGGGKETTECPLCFEDFDENEHNGNYFNANTCGALAVLLQCVS